MRVSSTTGTITRPHIQLGSQMFSVQEVQLDTAEGPLASTLSRYVTFFCAQAIRMFRAYCRIFRIFQQIARVAYFSAKLILSTAISVLFLFSIIIWLLGFVTSTIWLPTEWRHPCVRTPVEQDRVVGFRFAYFRRIFVFMRSAYLKIPHKLRCLLALPSFDYYTSANLQKNSSEKTKRPPSYHFRWKI